MAALQSKDFSKPSSGGPYAGQTRDKIFELKIKDKKEFILGATKNGKKVTGVKYDTKSRTFFYYEGSRKSNVKNVSYTQVFKDNDFGGGAGSGGGADDTKWTESLQCYYCAYVFNVKKGKCTAVSDAELKKAEKYVDAPSLKDCLNNGPADWIETDVYIKTANILYDKFKSKMKSPVYFHRGSPFMERVYKAKAACHAHDKKSGDPQAPGSFSNDKWNPGDIWASTKPMNSDPLKEFVGTWGELNAAVYKMAMDGDLLGISLKKIGPTASAKLTEFNSPKQQAKRESYSYKGYTYGKTGDFFSSQDIYLHTSEGDVQFRTFGGETSWQGEIKGGAAAGGKIGGGNVHFFTKQVIKKGIYGAYDNEKSFLAWARASQDGDYQERLFELYKKHNAKSTRSKPMMSEEDFYAELSTKDFKFKNSKLICMEFLEVLGSMSAKQKDEFTTKMFRYAQSDVDQSSYFVKIY